MKGKMLLFGFDILPEILALETSVEALGIELTPVARTDYQKTLGALAGLDAVSGPAAPYTGGPLGGRMIVLCELDQRLDEALEALRKAGVGQECLKAVLTPSNRSWSALRLYTELCRERQETRRARR